MATTILNKENNPLTRVISRDTVSVNPTHILANPNDYANGAAAFAPTTRENAAEPFLSLSKGTLKHTPLTLHTPQTRLQTMTKVYNDKVKFYRFKHLFDTSNTDDERRIFNDTEKKEQTPEQKKNSVERSLARTRREIADIVDSNDFDKFATFTFDPKKHPECDNYDYAKKKMIVWLSNQQAKYGAFRYLLIPERQSNGNLHFHALLGGFTGHYHATNMRGKGKNQRQCYKIDSWEKSNGFADMEDIGNKEATGKYIGKYIAKDITSDTATPQNGKKHVKIVEKYGKRYFSSKGLNKPQKLYNLEISSIIGKYDLDVTSIQDYENDHVQITTIKKAK